MHSSLSLAVGYNRVVTHGRRSCNNVVAIHARIIQPTTKESSMRDADSYAYVCEKFAVALEEIAAGEGPVKMRLHNAYISSLSRLSDDDLPEELREEFSSIYESASWLPPEAPEEGMMASTARHMSDEEARELCRRLVWLFYEFVTHPDAPQR
jgi:hypothetical protein